MNTIYFKKKVKTHNFFILLAVASLLIILSSCAPGASMLYYSRKEKIDFDFYPGKATVKVKEKPELTATIPGKIKLPKKACINSPFKGYHLSIEKDNAVIGEIVVKCPKPNPFKGVLALFADGMFVPITAITLVQGRIYEIRPNYFYVIDKNAAIELKDIKPILKAKNSSLEWVRADAAEALGKIKNDDAVDPLLKHFLNDHSCNVKSKTIEALGNYKNPEIYENLIIQADDESCLLSGVVASSIDKMWSRNIEVYLARVLNDDKKSLSFRLNVLNILKSHNSEIPANSFSAIMSAVMKDLKFDSETYSTFVRNYSKECVPHFEKMINNEKDSERLASIVMLIGEAGKDAKHLIPLIIEKYPVIEKKSKYLEETSINPVNDIKKDLSKKYGSHIKFKSYESKKRTKYYEYKIFYTVYAGAYALEKITGIDLGNEKSKWENWNKSNN